MTDSFVRLNTKRRKIDLSFEFSPAIFTDDQNIDDRGLDNAQLGPDDEFQMSEDEGNALPINVGDDFVNMPKSSPSGKSHHSSHANDLTSQQQQNFDFQNEFDSNRSLNGPLTLDQQSPLPTIDTNTVTTTAEQCITWTSYLEPKYPSTTGSTPTSIMAPVKPNSLVTCPLPEPDLPRPEKPNQYSAECTKCMWNWMIHHQECGLGGPIGLWKFAIYKNQDFTRLPGSRTPRTAASMASKYNKTVLVAERNCPDNILAWRALIRSNDAISQLRRIMHIRKIGQPETPYYFVMEDIYWIHETLRLGTPAPSWTPTMTQTEDILKSKIYERQSLALIHATHIAHLHPNYPKLHIEILKKIGPQILIWLNNHSLQAIRPSLSSLLPASLRSTATGQLPETETSTISQVDKYKLAILVALTTPPKNLSSRAGEVQMGRINNPTNPNRKPSIVLG